MENFNELSYIKSMLEVELNTLLKNTIWEIHDIIKNNNVNYNTFDILVVIKNDINIIIPLLYKEIKHLNLVNNEYIGYIRKTWAKLLNVFKQNIINSEDIINKINKFSLKNSNFDTILEELNII